MDKDPDLYLQHMREALANIPWRAIAGIGNILRHDYHQTYPTVLWETCKNDLQPLAEAAERLSAHIGNRAG